MSIIFFSLLFSILLHWESSTPGSGWSDPVNISNMSGDDCNPQIAVRGDTLHVVWDNGLGLEGQIMYRICENDDWLPPESITDDPWLCAGPSICIDSWGTIHVTWTGYSGFSGYGEIYYSKKEGGTWSEAENVSNAPDYNDGNQRIVVHSDNILHLVYAHDWGLLRYHKNENGVWRQPEELGNEEDWHAYGPDIVTDNCDRPHVAWYAYPQHDEIFYSKKITKGWTDPLKVSEEEGSSRYPKLAVDSRNRVHLVWQGRLGPVTDPEVMYRYLEDGTWSDTERLNPDVLGGSPDFVVDHGDTIHAVWVAQIQYSNYFLYSRRIDGEWASPDTIIDIGPFWPDLAVDGHNSLHSVYAYGHEIYYTRKEGPGPTVEIASLDIDPDSGEIIIPASGGSFGYTLILRNLTADVQAVEVWIGASLPDGEEYGPIFGPVEAVLDPFEVVARRVVQHVPGVAPYGAYCYHGYVAGSGSDYVLGQSHVRVIKKKN